MVMNILSTSNFFSVFLSVNFISSIFRFFLQFLVRLAHFLISQGSHYQNNITVLGRAVTVSMPAWTQDTNLSESYCSGTQFMEKRFFRYSLQIFVKLLLGPMTTKVNILKIWSIAYCVPPPMAEYNVDVCTAFPICYSHKHLVADRLFSLKMNAE